MDKEEKVCFFKDRLDWRAWLENNCQAEKSVWLIYYKKGTGQTSISYDEAVEEAICYGWIDGRVKRIDQARYKQRYSPRTAKSNWSRININRARKMISQGKMTPLGLKVYQNRVKA